MRVHYGKSLMRCIHCGKPYRKKLGRIMFKSRILGSVKTPVIKYDQCSGCGDRLLDMSTATILTDFIADREQKFVDSLPIGAFISLKHAAELLNMTPNKFRRNPRIQRGFILSSKIAGRRFYHMKSVRCFKKTGDGRKI